MTSSAFDKRQSEQLWPVSQTRQRVEHRVKSWPHLFEAIELGIKTHEVRKVQDRDYQAGDLLRLQEFDPETGTYSGREQLLEITYITSHDYPCALSEHALHIDYCILSVRKISNPRH